MAKAIDDCLFCGANPCECNKPVNPAKSTAKRRPAVERVPAGSAATDNKRDAVTAGPVPAQPVPVQEQAKQPVKIPTRKPASKPVAERTIPQPRARPDLSTIKNLRSEEEEEFRRAVTIIVTTFDCLPEDLKNNRQFIDLPSWKIDAIAWRQRRRDASH